MCGLPTSENVVEERRGRCPGLVLSEGLIVERGRSYSRGFVI